MTKENNAKISIIIPTKNRSELLKETIDSVLSQSHPLYEVIIVNDNSSSDHVKNMNLIATSNSRIHLYHMSKNKGVSAARNYGLQKAKGDYILFLDDDDLLHPKMLETSVKYFSQNSNIDVVVCLYEVFFSQDDLNITHPLSLLFNYKLLDKNPLKLVDHRNIVPQKMLSESPLASFIRYLIPIHSCLIRKKSIGNLRFSEDLLQGEDTVFWLLMAHKGCRFLCHDNIHVFIRRHSGNTTRSKTRYFNDITACYEKILGAGILTTKDEIFLVHLKLFQFKAKTKKSDAIKHLIYLLRSPVMLAKEFFLYSYTRYNARKRLMKYYYMD